MSTEFSEILEKALEQLRKNEPISEILDNYTEQAEYLAPLLSTAESLYSIPPVEMPSAKTMQMDRLEFLSGIESSEIPAVSLGLLVRIKEQMTHFVRDIKFSISNAQKEKQKMNIFLARAAMAFALFFGMTGGAYAMTENSLPDSPLYEAKLAMEQVQLQMQSDQAGAADQQLVMATHRVQEWMRLVQAGKELDEGLMTRLEHHLNAAFQLSAQLGDGEMQGVLTRAEIMLREQIQQMTKTQVQLSTASQAQLQLMNQLLTRAQNQAELGLQNPEAFREQVRNGSLSEQPGPGGPNGDQDCPNCPCVDCEPQGDKNQNQNQNGTQPDLSTESVTGQDCPNCPYTGCDGDQAQDQNHNQDQSHDQDQNHDQDQTGSGSGTGNGTGNGNGN